MKKLFDTIGARFATRPGGYTRILRLGTRHGDGAEMAYLELVGYEYKPAGKARQGGQAQGRPEGREEGSRAQGRAEEADGAEEGGRGEGRVGRTARARTRTGGRRGRPFAFPRRRQPRPLRRLARAVAVRPSAPAAASLAAALPRGGIGAGASAGWAAAGAGWGRTTAVALSPA